MKYKVGDKVRIKSLDWYNKNKDADGIVRCEVLEFDEDLSKFCNKIVTIRNICSTNNCDDDCYTIFEDYGVNLWDDEMIEGLVEEEVGLVDNFSSRRVNEFDLPEGYIFKDENGKVINATKIFLEKKKPKYPTTYIECAEILGFKPIHSLALQLVASHGFSIIDTQICAFERNLTIRLEYFRKLLICRDAYWEIAGDWKPDWNNGETKHCIYSDMGNVTRGAWCFCNAILAFPTAEMRDAFYENFKKEIEICKELL